MSEGPEIHRLAAEQKKSLGGGRILEVTTRLRKAQEWMTGHPDDIVGRQILDIDACGKHLLWYLEGDLWFHFHLLMFGKWEYHRPDAIVPYDQLMRAQIRTTNRLLTLCSGQVFDIGYGDPYGQVTALAALGPDICAVPFDAEEFKNRLLRPNNMGQELGLVLLDQTVGAGIGNYLKAEIMFECRLNPWRTIGSLTMEDVECLAAASALMGQRALIYRGWTLPDDLRESISATLEPGRYAGGNRHWVFRRTNHPCHICGTAIKQKRQGPGEGRWTFWCPNCQGPYAQSA